MAVALDRCEVDTARPFRSVKEAVAVFGDRILVGNCHSRHSSSSASAVAIATPTASANATSVSANANAKHEASSSSSTMTFSPTPMAESVSEIMAATVPMYSAPSSPTSLASSPSPSPVVKPRSGRGGDDDNKAAAGGGLVTARSIKKLEADVAETRREVAQLRKRGNEMEMALASLGAQLHRGLSKLADMEADRAAAAARRRSVGGDTDVASSSTLRWGGGDSRLAASECYLPSFSHALSLGEMDDDVELVAGGGRRRKARKVKPIVPLIGDILFSSSSRRKSSKEKCDGGFYSGDLYGVLG